MKLQAILDSIERAGNKLPNPAMLFVYLCLTVLLVSAICAALAVEVIHPLDGKTIAAVNLLSVAGLHRILLESVTNFTGFAPVGTVLVAIMGVGIADHSGLLKALLRATVLKAPSQFLSFIIVFSGVMSSMAMDTGYVVLIPLAAVVFASAGRHPLAGIAAAFAGVSGGFSANLMIGPVDALLGGISTEAAALVQPGYEVTAAANYYFMFASTILLSLLGTWVTEKLVIPRLPVPQNTGNVQSEQISAAESRGLKYVAVFTALFVGVLLAGLLPGDGVLRDPQTGGVLTSPFIKGIVTIIAFYAAMAGILYGRVSGSYQRTSDFVDGMEQNMATMAGYLVLMFFAAQFVSYFSWSNLGSIIAISGAKLLEQMQLNQSFLLVSFIPLVAFINLFIGSASAKWALIAPVFVPMFLLSGISPEATQVAYRIGDSSTNIITPLMPYFGVVVAFARKHDPSIGIGTIIAIMLPYSVSFLIGWSLFLLLWILIGIPIGPGVSVFI
jgi:aminobenzoyl-glutamate transport protein